MNSEHSSISRSLDGSERADLTQRNLDRFEERAVPRSLAVHLGDTQSESDADSVTSDYKEDNPQQRGASPIEISIGASQSSLASSLTDDWKDRKKVKPEQPDKSDSLIIGSDAGQKKHSKGAKHKSQLGDLPSLSNSRPGIGASLTGGPSPSRTGGMSPSASGNAWASRAGGSEFPLMASTAGEWVSRLQALDEVSAAHKECAVSILSLVEEIVPGASRLSPEQRKQLLEKMNGALDESKSILARHAHGLIGSDLAELRILKTENKQMADKMNKMNKQCMKELSLLRDKMRVTPQGTTELIQDVVANVISARDEYEPLAYLSVEQRSCVLAILEEKLMAVLSERPQLKAHVNKTEMSRLEDQFKQERLASLEKKILHLQEQNADAMRAMAVIEAQKNQLKKDLDRVSRENELLRTSNSTSTGSRMDTNDDEQSTSLHTDSSGTSRSSATSVTMRPNAPAGKPKSGRRPVPAMATRLRTEDSAEESQQSGAEPA